MYVCMHVCMNTCVSVDVWYVTHIPMSHIKETIWVAFFQIWAPLEGLAYSKRGLCLFESLSDKQIFKCKQYWRDCFKHWSIDWHLEGKTTGPMPVRLATDSWSSRLAGEHAAEVSWGFPGLWLIGLRNSLVKQFREGDFTSAHQSAGADDAKRQTFGQFANHSIGSPGSTFLPNRFCW